MIKINARKAIDSKIKIKIHEKDIIREKEEIKMRTIKRLKV